MLLNHDSMNYPVGPGSEQSLSTTLMIDESMKQPLNYFNCFIGLII